MEEEKREIYSLAAETLAVQAVLVHVLRRLAKSDPNLWKAIAAGFDDAAREVETLAIQYGAEAKSKRTLQAIRLVETCRKGSLGAGLVAENCRPNLRPRFRRVVGLPFDSGPVAQSRDRRDMPNASLRTARKTATFLAR